VLCAASTLAAGLAVTAHADFGGVPSAPAEAQNRSVDPVVLTGNQFASWSAGPEVVAHEPGSPLNSSTVGQEGSAPPGTQSDCYDPDSNPYDSKDNGDHSCVQESRVPSENNTVADAANGALNTTIGADVNRIVGYRWDGGKFVQFPLQVDERFTRFLSNNASDFAVYSGTDQETNYAFDREGFRYTSDQSQTTPGGDACLPVPRKNSPALNAKGYSAQSDPIRGLDDNDEIAFMWRDAGADQAPSGATFPDGVLSSYQVAVADPSNPSQTRFAYVALAKSDTNPGATQKKNPHGKPVGPPPETVRQWNEKHAYVHYTRDATADIFVYSQSSYSGYGAAPKGPYCTVNADGTHSASTAHDTYAQRRPGDQAWITTPRYAFRYDGRWLMTQLRICPANGRCGLVNGQPSGYGPNILDQWKARAFQQRPSGTTPCCGYEEEVNNWGGSSILFGERWGPVRVIRAAWGSDSSTNNIKTEVFYPDTISFQDNLRVHVIPPFDGIYSQWDYNAGMVSKYFNPYVPKGVAIDGKNDEVFGNTRMHVGPDGVGFTDGDPIPVVGPQDLSAGDPTHSDCGPQAGDACIDNDIDVPDPTFGGAVAGLNYEEITGPHGTLVDRIGVKQVTAGSAYSVIAVPYYRDDACFDDGTGTDPGLHVKGRGVDPVVDSSGHKRVCWSPADGDPAKVRPRDHFFQGDIGTHGIHLEFIADSDNAAQTVPLDEIDSEQRIVVLSGPRDNVGEQYGRGTEKPLVVTVLG